MGSSIAAVLANEQPWHVENDDVFAGLAALPDRSIHAIVSSPPYLGLRDYGIHGRLWPDGLTCCYGLEPDVASYVRHTVMLFEEFRRVLRDDGQIWWNVGSSFASSDITMDEYVMRDDLSDDEKQFVLEELAKWPRV